MMKLSVKKAYSMAEFKKMQENIIKDNKNVCQINTILNNDCLMNIFTYLPIKDRIKIERVCSRWFDLSKLSWSNFNDFSLLDLQRNTNLFKRNKAGLDIIQIIFKFLSRCGKYLHLVDISDYDYVEDDWFKLRLGVCYLANFCSNITVLTLSGEGFDGKADGMYGLIFSKNRHLKSVKIERTNLEGICLLQLPVDTLEELRFVLCKITPFTDFAIHFEKLKILTMCNSNHSYCSVFKPFRKNKKIVITAPNINEFIDLTNKLNGNLDISTLLLETHNVKGLTLSDTILSNEVIKILPVKSMEFFILFHCTISTDNLVYCLQNFENLTTLGLQNMTINEKIAECISYCKNLENLLLRSTNFPNLSSDIAHKIFKSLPKLELLDLSYSGINDNFLAAILEHCKELHSLNLNYCKNISDTGLANITSLEALEELSIEGAPNITDSAINFISTITTLSCGNSKNIKKEGLCNFIKTSPKLEKLYKVKGCEDILKDIIDLLSE